MNPPRVDDPEESEKIIVGLAQRASRLYFEFCSDDATIALIRAEDFSKRATNPESGHYSVARWAVLVRLKAEKDGAVLFEGLLRIGRTNVLLESNVDYAQQDHKCFIDYLFLLLEGQDLERAPEILIDGTRIN